MDNKDKEILSSAIEVIKLAKIYGYDKPMKTDFYRYFAGVLSASLEEAEEEFSWEVISKITNKVWQEAKQYIYSEFEFRQ